jgi:hypothetical protein
MIKPTLFYTNFLPIGRSRNDGRQGGRCSSSIWYYRDGQQELFVSKGANKNAPAKRQGRK